MSIAEKANYLVSNIQNNDAKNEKFPPTVDSIILLSWVQFLPVVHPEKSPR